MSTQEFGSTEVISAALHASINNLIKVKGFVSQRYRCSCLVPSPQPPSSSTSAQKGTSYAFERSGLSCPYVLEMNCGYNDLISSLKFQGMELDDVSALH